jgi:hypothetical protein
MPEKFDAIEEAGPYYRYELIGGVFIVTPLQAAGDP